MYGMNVLIRIREGYTGSVEAGAGENKACILIDADSLDAALDLLPVGEQMVAKALLDKQRA